MKLHNLPPTFLTLPIFAKKKKALETIGLINNESGNFDIKEIKDIIMSDLVDYSKLFFNINLATIKELMENIQ